MKNTFHLNLNITLTSEIHSRIKFFEAIQIQNDFPLTICSNSCSCVRIKKQSAIFSNLLDKSLISEEKHSKFQYPHVSIECRFICNLLPAVCFFTCNRLITIHLPSYCERRRSEITIVIQPSICDVHAYVYCIVLLFLIIYYRWLV